MYLFLPFVSMFPCWISPLESLFHKSCCGLAFWSVWLWEGSWQVEWDGEEDESLWCFLQFCGQVLQSCWFFKHQRTQCITSKSCHCNVEAKIQVVAQGKGEDRVSKSDSKRESEHPGNLCPVWGVVMMLPPLWLCLTVVTAVTPVSHQLQGAEFL